MLFCFLLFLSSELQQIIVGCSNKNHLEISNNYGGDHTHENFKCVDINKDINPDYTDMNCLEDNSCKTIYFEHFNDTPDKHAEETNIAELIKISFNKLANNGSLYFDLYLSMELIYDEYDIGISIFNQENPFFYKISKKEFLENYTDCDLLKTAFVEYMLDKDYFWDGLYDQTGLKVIEDQNKIDFLTPRSFFYLQQTFDNCNQDGCFGTCHNSRRFLNIFYGHKLFNHMYNFLESIGFKEISIIKNYKNPFNGRNTKDLSGGYMITAKKILT